MLLAAQQPSTSTSSSPVSQRGSSEKIPSSPPRSTPYHVFPMMDFQSYHNSITALSRLAAQHGSMGQAMLPASHMMHHMTTAGLPSPIKEPDSTSDGQKQQRQINDDEYINVVDVEDVEGKSIPFHQTSTPAKTSSLCSSAPAQPTLQSSTHLPARHSHHPAIKYNHLSVYPVSAMLNSQPSRTVSPSSHHHTTVVQPTRSVTPVDRTVIARSSTTPDNKQDHPANDVTPDNKCGSPNSDSGVYSTNQQSSPDSSPAKSSPASSGKSDLDSTITSDPSLLSPRIGAVINEKPKKARTVYSAQQIYGLESLFRANQYPDPDTIERVSQDLDITEAKIKVWFQNKRARLRRRLGAAANKSEYSVMAMPGLPPHPMIPVLHHQMAAPTSPQPLASPPGVVMPFQAYYPQAYPYPGYPMPGYHAMPYPSWEPYYMPIARPMVPM